MFIPIFKANVQGQKHRGRCAFAEPELISYRKPKRVVQKKKNDNKNSNNSHNSHDEIELDQGFSKKNTYWHSTPEQRTPQKQSYKLWWGAYFN